VHPVTVSKWRHRFATDRLEGLSDAPRPGAARNLGDDVIEAVLVDTLESAPPDATHWSTRGLAKKRGISHDTVAEIWRRSGSNRGGRTVSRSLLTLTWSRRSATWSGCT
jgi:Homeodomain-like domain